MDPYEISLFTAALILFMAVVILFFLLLFFFIRRQRIYTRQLKQQTSAGQQLAEAARSRFSMDLHDGVRSLLSGIRVQLMLVRQGGEPASGAAERALTAIDELNDRLREIAHNLSPRLLAEKGLAAALDNLVYQRQEMAGPALVIELCCHLSAEPTPEAGVHLYRITEELLQNAVAHSGARRIALRLEETNRAVRLLYRDDGCGFSYPAKTGGQGLANLHSRVTLLDGRMDCRSQSGKGTSFLFSIPKQIIYGKNQNGRDR